MPPWPFPERIPFQGRSVRLEPLGREHAGELWHSTQQADPSFAHLRYGPFATENELLAQVIDLAGRAEQPFWAVRPQSSDRAQGWLSLCDIYPADGAIEIGAIWFSPRLQRTRAATEAIYLCGDYGFSLGYRRYEWKCNNRNEPSKRAAVRYGFKFEGLFRQHQVVKGQNRDTAWYSIIDTEWPARKAAFERWLAPANFDKDGRQMQGLAALNAA